MVQAEVVFFFCQLAEVVNGELLQECLEPEEFASNSKGHGMDDALQYFSSRTRSSDDL